MNTFSYEENGIMKISTDIMVPDHLVNILIGKKGENVRNIMSKTGASINFSKEYNDDCKINTSNGIGRFCNLKGTPQQNGLAMKMISEMIIKYEPIKIGSRPKK
jgi:predicted PilT family ATPase